MSQSSQEYVHLSPLFSFSCFCIQEGKNPAPAKVSHWRKVRTGSEGKGINVLQGEACCGACSLWQHAAAAMSAGATVVANK